MKYVVNEVFEPTVSFSLVEVNNEIHVLATDGSGESFILATIGEPGILINAGVPTHLGLNVDTDGELVVNFESESDDSEFGTCTCEGCYSVSDEDKF